MNRSTHVMRLSMLLICALGLLLSACEKKEIQGPKGDPGDRGGGGNSSISSTSVFTVTSSQWAVDSVAECRQATINFSSLTNDVVETGAVKVYVQQGTTWVELPFTRG